MVAKSMASKSTTILAIGFAMLLIGKRNRGFDKMFDSGWFRSSFFHWADGTLDSYVCHFLAWHRTCITPGL